MIEILEGDGRYWLGMWNVSFPGGDWMACVWKEKDAKEWSLTYRFRYYTGKQVGDPFLDEDTKKWWKGHSKENWSDDVGVAHMRTSMQMLIEGLGGRNPEELLVQGDSKKFMELLKSGKSSYIHTKEVPLAANPKEDRYVH